MPVSNQIANSVAPFDSLRATADYLQKELTAGRLTSTQIVEEYHRSIERYNGYLNAVYELAPHAMTRAQEMDKLRSEGRVLGPLHGIPIILKVSPSETCRLMVLLTAAPGQYGHRTQYGHAYDGGGCCIVGFYTKV